MDGILIGAGQMIDDRISDNKMGAISAGMIFGGFLLIGVTVPDSRNAILIWYGAIVVITITTAALIWLNGWPRMHEVVQRWVGEQEWEYDEIFGWICTDSKKWVQWVAVLIWTLWFTFAFVLATVAHNSALFTESPATLVQIHQIFRVNDLHPIWRFHLALQTVILVVSTLTILTWWVKKVTDFD